MSLFYRHAQPSADEVRGFEHLSSMIAAINSGSYATVDPTQGLTAMQSVAVWSTADLVASLASELPAEVYSGRSKRSVPGNVDDPGGDGLGREDWLYRVLMSWLIRGNTYGAGGDYDTRTGRARTVDLLAPSKVRAEIVGGKARWYNDGKVLEGRDLADFVHWRVNPQPGALLGLSVVEHHATSIGISLRSAQFGDQWFKDGAHPSGMLVNKADLKTVDAEAAKRRLIAQQQGNREPLVLGQGWDYKDLQVSPEESQFIQTQGYSEAQCARMFGPGFAEILGYETGGSMTYANVVDRRQDLLVLSMNKWIRRAERVLTSLLPPSTQTVKLNREALLESTTLQRYQAHKLALDAGWLLPSEVREIEDLPVIDGIDDRKPNTQGVPSGNAAQS